MINGVMSVMTLKGPAIPDKTPAIVFIIPNAPKLIAVAAIEAPRMAAETGLEQEKKSPANKAGARNRM